ncbi:MAG: hypothetical protein DI551_07865 [Micavibrio aeruginosavorus]|uniref:Uncharacterized protein n=1 Tax=Micavibrio aeruginosavorus TaxID=349221 RepID=A0A2W5PRX8_9BACT|nr:MAG: hypothetical protein DI551_07865 [Micavibrio aeruginosavorus]
MRKPDTGNQRSCKSECCHQNPDLSLRRVFQTPQKHQTGRA